MYVYRKLVFDDVTVSMFFVLSYRAGYFHWRGIRVHNCLSVLGQQSIIQYKLDSYTKQPATGYPLVKVTSNVGVCGLKFRNANKVYGGVTWRIEYQSIVERPFRK